MGGGVAEERLHRRHVVALLPGLFGIGCTSIGPAALDRDQLGYTNALAEAGKRQTLLNIVRLRYADPPSFVAISQVISGYTLQATGQAGLNAYPSASASNFANIFGQLQYIDRPTFTLSPVTGEQFAQSYVRPFAPAEVLPLSQAGVPIDVLLRLAAQSIGPLQNTQPLNPVRQGGSPDFFRLLQVLRYIQENSGLSIRLLRERERHRIFLSLDDAHDRSLRPAIAEAYRLLRLDAASREVEVVYGRAQSHTREVAVLTRSLLLVYTAVAAEMEVPEEDVRANRTIPTLLPEGQRRAVIVIHAGPSAPDGAYATVRVGGISYWIEQGDFASKAAFTILELLKVLAEGSRGTTTPVLTIPAG